MEISTYLESGTITLQLKGRLDGSWAGHLSESLEETIRQGHHFIRVNMTDVVYLSSLGIRVLVTFHKKLQAIEGTFEISDASEPVQKVLDLVGLKARLMRVSAPPVPQIAAQPSRSFEFKNGSFEVFELGPRQALTCELIGQPALLNGCRFTEKDCKKIAFGETSVGIGLGAFGQDFADCRERFGEFMAVAGAAAYQPSDGSNAPDFLLAEGSLIPELQVLYGAAVQGPMTTVVRFEAKTNHAAVSLTELADAALSVCETDQVALVCVAESAGLVGARLRKSPVNGATASAPFGHPEVREWLSFTTERAYHRALTVVTGIASRAGGRVPQEILRPMAGSSGILGHFHAAAFSYRPLQRGVIDLQTTVRSLFEHETLLGILHLIGDDRDAVGVSESEFVRGACWAGKIGSAA